MKNQMIFLTIAMLFSGLAMAGGMPYEQNEQIDQEYNNQIQTNIEILLQKGVSDAGIESALQGYGLTNAKVEEFIKDAKEAEVVAEEAFYSGEDGN